MACGIHVPFTVALMDSIVELNLTSSDWMQLCRVYLSGRDYLLWRDEIQGNCSNTSLHNTTVGFPQCNLDMLTGAGQYAGLAAQITYDPAVCAQIAAVAVKAGKALFT